MKKLLITGCVLLPLVGSEAELIDQRVNRRPLAQKVSSQLIGRVQKERREVTDEEKVPWRKRFQRKRRIEIRPLISIPDPQQTIRKKKRVVVLSDD